ncbi:MAG: PspC domain-containing protein [Candidatus Kapaibacterium sp.]
MEQKRLYRSRRDRMIGGVAGGLAEYFDIDPVIVRIIFIITALGWGVSLIAYIIMWIVVPERPEEPFEVNRPGDYESGGAESAEHIYSDYETNPDIERIEKRSRDRRYLGAAVLILLGGFFLLDNFIPAMDFDYIWPLVLIGIGAYILLKK